MAVSYNVLTRETKKILIPHNYSYNNDERNFIITIPHSSPLVPLIFKNNVDIENPSLQNDIDYFTNQIYTLKNIGAVRIEGGIHRDIIDLNRDKNSEIVFRENSFDGSKLIVQQYTEGQKKAMLKKFYDPFHDSILKEINYQKSKHGEVFILNGHSMQSIPPKTRNKETRDRPGFCIGVNDYQNIRRELADAFEETLRFEVKDLESTVEIDYPFQGAKGIGEMYSDLNENQNVMLLEVNQGLYMDETDKTAKDEMIAVINQSITNSIEEVLREMGR